MKHLGRRLAGCVTAAAMAAAGSGRRATAPPVGGDARDGARCPPRLVHSGRDRGRAGTDDCVGRRRGSAARRPGRRRARHRRAARPDRRARAHLRSRRRENGAALRRDDGPQRRRADVRRRGAPPHGEERTSGGTRCDGRWRPPAAAPRQRRLVRPATVRVCRFSSRQSRSGAYAGQSRSWRGRHQDERDLYRAGLPDTDPRHFLFDERSCAPSSRRLSAAAFQSRRTRTATRAPPTPCAPASAASNTGRSCRKRRSA